MGSSCCFVPGCKTGYLTDKNKRKREGKSQPSLFKAPYEHDKIMKWRIAIRRADKELTSDDKVCELHFLPEDLITHFVHKMPDGTVQRLKRGKKALADNAIPTIFPYAALHLTEYKRRRTAPAKRIPLTEKARHRKSITDNISTMDDTATNNIPTMDDTALPLFTFKDLVEKLPTIKIPHILWSLSSHGTFIVCVKWDKDAAPERQIIVDENLGFKVLYYGTEVSIRPNYIIDSAESLSCIIIEVDNYEVCLGSIKENKNCSLYIPRLETSGRPSIWCKSCKQQWKAKIHRK